MGANGLAGSNWTTSSSKGSYDSTTPTVSPTFSSPPTARCGIEGDGHFLQPLRDVGLGDLAAIDQAAGEQLLAGLELDGGHEVVVEAVEVAHRALDLHVLGHLRHRQRLLDLGDGGVGGHGLRQHVDLDARLVGDGLVLGRLHVGDEGERADARRARWRRRCR